MDLFEDQPGDNAPEFTVSEISGAIKRVIEGEFGRVRVRGEIGRVFVARSGHLYYDIKDDKNVLSCTTWKGQVSQLSVTPEEGLEVVVTGRLTTFGAQSKYNMNVDEMAVAGQGALMAMLEKRKKALEAEGLFAAERKKPLPFLPEIIGVVTSPSGAVIRDILHRLRDRFPRKVLIWPVAVQGQNCAPEVANAIRGFNALTPGGALPRPDVIIVARGGGSIEDLWGFNEEIVARAAAASAIPLISAVGHETDTTLIDYVSDRRAPTPTAAAEMAVPVRLDLLGWVREQEARLARGVTQGLERRRQRLSDLSRILPRPEALLSDPRQRLDRAEDRLEHSLSRMVERKRARLAEVSGAIRPQALRARIEAERRRLEDRAGRLEPGLRRATAKKQDRLDAVAARLRVEPITERLERRRMDLDRVAPRLGAVFTARLGVLTERLETLDRMRRSLGYQATLARGYAVVRSGARVVTRAAAAKGVLEIEFSDGRVRAEADGTAPKDTSDQGSLL
jgi:exodeoxyribonuclease VII large subunit